MEGYLLQLSRRLDPTAPPLGVFEGVRAIREEDGTTVETIDDLTFAYFGEATSFHKIGKFVRFDLSEIELWIAERRVDVAS